MAFFLPFINIWYIEDSGAFVSRAVSYIMTGTRIGVEEKRPETDLGIPRPQTPAPPYYPSQPTAMAPRPAFVSTVDASGAFCTDHISISRSYLSG